MTLPTLFLAAAAETTDSVPAAPVLILMAFGVLVAVFGHIYKSRTVVAMGLFLLFLATAAMIVGGYIAYEQGDPDIRKPENPSSPDF